MIKEYINKESWEIKENSNQAFSLQGMNNYIGNKITKEFWLNEIYTQGLKQMHEDGVFHIHDLGLLAPYCVGWDLMDLLREGFKGVEGKIESSPAKHFGSALGQIVNFLYTMQGEAAGAQALSNFDTLLAPFIFYDKLSFIEVKQEMQQFVFNMNVSTRVGFQTVFSNLTMDITCPKTLKDVGVIVGGGTMGNDVYSDFQDEMDMINKAFAQVMCEGDAKGRVFTFPIPTYNITKDTDFESEVLDDVWKMAGKYGTPYFCNYINSDLDPEDTVSMCCRLRIDTTQIKRRGGGLFGSSPLVGSMGVVTINLPQLAHRCKKDLPFLLKNLNAIIHIACFSLELKRRAVEDLTEKGFYPYSKFYLRSVKKRTGKYWSNHFSTIGVIGMNEACQNFFGDTKKDITSKEGVDFAYAVMDNVKDRIELLQEETGTIINLEATPAEGTTAKLAKKDLGNFHEIITAGTKNNPYYTNSTQLPVEYTDDVGKAIAHQEPFQQRYTGGTVFHTYLGSCESQPTIVKRFVQTVFQETKMPYLSISPTFSICPKHGYIVGEKSSCPTCGAGTEVYSKVVGYVRPLKQWNDSKKVEFCKRMEFNSLEI